LDFKPCCLQFAFCLANVGSVIQHLRWHTNVNRVHIELEEIHLLAFDWLWITTSEKINSVFRFNQFLLDDQLFTLVLTNFSLKTLNGQFCSPRCFFIGFGNLETSLLKSDGDI